MTIGGVRDQRADGGRDAPELATLVGRWAWAPWLVGALVLLRLLAVGGLRLYQYVDSSEYDILDLSGRWRRPWAVPLLYRLIPGDDAAVVMAQALIGALCWSALALCAAAWFRHPRLRLAVAGTLGVLACTTGVTSWDGAKLSESLAVSLTVLLVAAWLELVRRRSELAGAAVVLVTVPWLFVRQSLLLTGWLVVALAAAGVVVSWRRGQLLRVLAAVTVLLALATTAATISYGRNQEVVRENLTVIVSKRVAPHAERLAWFRAEGMPVPSDGRTDPASLRADPAFQDWVAGEGRSTYARFLATHPRYVLFEPLDDLVGVRRPAAEPAESTGPPPVMLAPPDTYASARPVVPDLAERALNGPGDGGTVVAAVLVALAWSAARWRRRTTAWVVPAGLALASAVSLYTGWHGAVPELGRLGLVGSLGLRVAVILQLALLVEGEILSRSGAPEASA